MADSCDATYLFGDDVLHCTADVGHDKPTGADPQGRPHEDANSPDPLSDEPRRWWS